MRVEKMFREANSAMSANTNHGLKKLSRLIEVLRTMTEDKFTGYIRINYSQGVIAKVEKFEEILKK